MSLRDKWNQTMAEVHEKERVHAEQQQQGAEATEAAWTEWTPSVTETMGNHREAVKNLALGNENIGGSLAHAALFQAVMLLRAEVRTLRETIERQENPRG